MNRCCHRFSNFNFMFNGYLVIVGISLKLEWVAYWEYFHNDHMIKILEYGYQFY